MLNGVKEVADIGHHEDFMGLIQHRASSVLVIGEPHHEELVVGVSGVHLKLRPDWSRSEAARKVGALHLSRRSPFGAPRPRCGGRRYLADARDRDCPVCPLGFRILVPARWRGHVLTCQDACAKFDQRLIERGEPIGPVSLVRGPGEPHSGGHGRSYADGRAQTSAQRTASLPNPDFRADAPPALDNLDHLKRALSSRI